MSSPDRALGDVSNQKKKQADKHGFPRLIKTFSRKSRALKAADLNHTREQPAPSATPDKGDAESLEASPVLAAVPRAARARKVDGYSRKVLPPPDEQVEIRRRAYLAAMRAHFAEVDKFKLAVDSPGAASAPSPSAVSQLPPEGGRLPLRDPTPLSIRERTAAWVPELPASFPAAELSPVLPKTQPQPPLGPGQNEGDEGQAASDLANVAEGGHDGAVGVVLAPVADSEPHATLSQSAASVGGALTPRSEAARPAPAPVIPGTWRTSKPHTTAKRPESSSRTAPAYGLSRRSSVCFAGRASLLEGTPLSARHSRFAPQATSAAWEKRFSAARTFQAQPRASLLSRLSNGLSDTLHRLGVKGAAPAAQGEASVAQDRSANGPLPDSIVKAAGQRVASSAVASPQELQPRYSSMWQGGEFSPIAESPDDLTAASPQPAAASPQLPPASPSPDSTSRQPTAATPPPDTATPGKTAALLQPEAGSPEHKHMLQTPGSGVQGRSASDMAVASITAALKHRLQLDGSPAPGSATSETRSAARLDDRDTEDLTTLQQLLQVCNQSTDERGIPSMEALLGEHIDLAQVRKIGEGTFGEAFRGGDIVFKIVPLDGATLVNGEVQKRADEILAEVAISLTLSQLRGRPGEVAANATSGFVETHGVGICRGHYAPALLAEWHAWDEQHGSENEPVDAFPGDQLYVVFVVTDGGLDLERFEPRSFAEAKSILLQCAMTLAVAEEACEFEHRDLHWGNILLRRQMPQTAHFRLRSVDIKVETGGLLVTLIDFTLSRLQTLTGDVAFCDLAADPELFQGPKGDCQAETYRRMRKATKGEWQLHNPATNILWMHYLADLLLNQKQLPCTAHQKRELRNFRKKALSYASCTELIVDDFFGGMWRIGETS